MNIRNLIIISLMLLLVVRFVLAPNPNLFTNVNSPPHQSWHNAAFQVSTTDYAAAGLYGCFFHVYDFGINNWTASWNSRTCNSQFTITTQLCPTESFAKCQVYAFAADNNFQIGDPFTIEYSMDYTRPSTAAAITGTSAGSFFTSDVSVSLSCSDPLSGCSQIKFCVDNPNTCTPSNVYSSPIPITTDGTTYVRYMGLDVAGNTEDVKSNQIIIDRLAPTAALGNVPNNWQNTDALIVLACADAVSGCDSNQDYYFLSTSSPCPTFSPSTYSTYENAVTVDSHTGFCYSVADNAGNRFTSSVETEIKVDKVPPTIADNYAFNGIWVRTDQTVTLNPQDTGNSRLSQVKTCTGAGCTPSNILSPPYQLSFSTDQDTIVRYQAFDLAGNPSAIGQFSVKLDKTSPSISISHFPANPTNSDMVTFTATTNEPNINVIEIFVDGALVKSCSSSPCTHTAGPFETFSTHNYSATISDLSLNSANSATGAFSIVNRAPTLSSISVRPQFVKLGTTLTVIPTSNEIIEVDTSIVPQDILGDPDGQNIVLKCGTTSGVYSSATNPINTTAINTTEEIVNEASLLITAPWSDDGTKTIYCVTNDGFLDSPEVSATVTSDNTMPTLSFTHSPTLIGPQTQVEITATSSDTNLNIIGIFVDNVPVKLCDDINQTQASCTYNNSYSSGTHSYLAGAADKAYNVVLPNVNYFTIDSSPPVISMQSPIATTYGTSSVALNFAANDTSGISQCGYELDGINTTLSSCQNTTLSGLSDGTHSIKVFANDAVGNMGLSSTVNFNIDLTGPTITIQSPSNSTFGTTSLNLNYVATDTSGVSQCRLELNRINFTLPSCQNTTINGIEGTNIIKIYANDTFNNFNVSPTVVFSIDTTNPSVTQPTVSSTLLKSSDVLVVNVTILDTNLNPSSVKANSIQMQQLSNNLFSLTTTPNSLACTATGTCTIRFNVSDTLGNFNDTTTVSVAIDNTAPSVSIQSPSSIVYNVNSVALNYAVFDVGGISECKRELDGINSTLAGCANATLTNLPEGNHVVKIFTKDILDNENSSAVSFGIDTQGPLVSIQSPLNQTYNTTLINLNYTTFDVNGISRCILELDGINSTLAACSNASLTASEGSHVAKIFVNDTLNNFNSSLVSFSVDTTPPVINVTSVTSSQGTNNWFEQMPLQVYWFSDNDGIAHAITVSGSLSDSFSGPNRTVYSSCFGETASTDFGSTFSTNEYSIAANGADSACNLTIRGYDNAGNSVAAVIEFREDNTAPSGSITNISENSPFIYVLNNDTVYFSRLMLSAESMSITANVSDLQSGMTSVQFGSFGITGVTTDTSLPYQATYQIINTTNAGTITLDAFDNVNNAAESLDIITMVRDIIVPAVSVQSPNSSSLLAGNMIFEIKWSSNDSLSSLGTLPITIEYASDGFSYSIVAQSLPNNGFYSWTIPADNTNAARIRIKAIDNVGNEGQAVSDAFSIDSTLPSITSAVTNDTNSNGKLDILYIAFNEPVNIIDTNASDALLGLTLNTHNITPAIYGASNTTSLVLNLVEGSFDTSVRPTISFLNSSPSIKDIAGNILVNGTSSSADGAIPRMVTAQTSDGNSNGKVDSVIVTFSEDLLGTSVNPTGTDFNVIGYTISSADEISAGIVNISLNEIGFDTNATPTVSIASGQVIKDLNRNNLTSGNINAQDSAKPVMIESTTTSRTSLRIFFSEDISILNSTGFLVSAHTLNTTTKSSFGTVDLTLVSSMNTGETPIISLLANSVNDTVGNANILHNIVARDGVKPFVTLVELSDPSPTKAGNVFFTVSFSESMNQSLNVIAKFGLTSPFSQNIVSGNWLNTTTWVGNFTITGGDATNTLNVSLAQDTSGNFIDENLSFTFVIDTIAPSSLAVSPAYDNVGAIDVGYSVNETGSGLSNVTLFYRYDSDMDGSFEVDWTASQTSTNASGTFVFSTIGDGRYQFRTIAIDDAYNSEVKVSHDTETIYDTTEPNSLITTSGFFNASSYANITGTASDATSGVSYVDISIQRTSDSMYWNGLTWVSNETFVRANGTTIWIYPFTPTDGFTFFVSSRARDNATNVETTLGNSTFTYDATLPVIVVTSPNGNEQIAGGSSFVIAWSALDSNFINNSASIEFSSDNGTTWATIATNQLVDTPFVWNVPVIDTNLGRIRVNATDLAGNRGNDTSDTSFIIDSTSPVVSIQSPTNTTLGTSNITLTFLVSELNGLSQCLREFDGVNSTIPSCQNTTFITTEGTHVLRILATDNAGNTGTSPSVVFSVDLTGPTISIQSPSNTTFDTSSVQINYDASDPIGISQCSAELNGINTTLSSCQNTTLTGIEGTNTLKIYANDTLGNYNVSSVLIFTIDTTKPSVFLPSVNDTLLRSVDSILVSVNVTDEHLNTSLVSVNNIPMTFVSDNIFSVSTTGAGLGCTSDGLCVLRFNASDTLGNFNDTTTIDVTIDNTAPSIVQVITNDTDSNGKVDTLIVSFSENVAVVDGNVSDGLLGTSATDLVITNNDYSLTNTTSLTLAITESAFNTGIAPVFTYVQTGGIKDLAGNELPNTNIVALDRAAPVMVSAATSDSNSNNKLDRVDVTFSEDIAASTVSAADFDVSGFSIILAAEISPGVVGIAISESTLDTGQTPLVSILAGQSIDDINGNSIVSGSVTAQDGIRPYVKKINIPSLVTTGSVSVALHFSEQMNISINPTITFGLTSPFNQNPASGIWHNSTQFNGSLIVTQSMDGTNTVNVSGAIDLAGNLIVINDTNTFVIDTTGPAISIQIPTNTTFVTSSVGLEFGAADSSGVDTCKYELDGSNTTLVGCVNTTLAGLSDGSHTVKVFANDTLGNENQASVIFTVDTTSPLILLQSPVATIYGVNNIPLTFAVYDSSDVSQCIQELDGVNSTIASCQNTTLTSLSEGSHSIKIFATDAVGNQNVSDAITFFVDTIAPVTTDSGTDTIWHNTDITVTLACNDGVGSDCSQTMYCVDISNSCTPDTPYLAGITISSDGEWYIRFSSTDNVGNSENIQNADNIVKVDKNPPATSDDYTAKDGIWQNTDQTIILMPSCGVSNCEWTRYCIGSGCDPSTGTDYTSPINFDIEGTTLFRYASKDNAGNVQSTVERSVKIDKTNPTTSDNAPLGWQTSDITITVTPADAVSGISLTEYCTDTTNTCDPASGTSYLTPVTISTEGTTYFRYSSTDNAGNVQTTVSKIIQLDKTSPTVNAGVDQTTNTQILQDATVSDAASGIATYSWSKVSGPGTVTFGSPTSEDTTIQADVDGTYQIRLTVIDVAGISAFGEITFIWDTTAPTVTLLSPQTSSLVNVSLYNFVFSMADVAPTSCILYINGINGGSASNVISGVPTTIVAGFPEGTNSWYVSCTDPSGNVGQSETRILTADLSRPVLVSYTLLVENEAATTNNVSISPANQDGVKDGVKINVTANETINFTIRILPGGFTAVDNNAIGTVKPSSCFWLGTTGQCSGINLTDGVYTIEIKMIDTAGNLQTDATKTITIDNTKPSITIVSPTNDSIINGISTQFNFAVSDATTTLCSYTFDTQSNDIANCQNMTLSGLSHGPHNLTLKAVDAANNTASATVFFNVSLSGSVNGFVNEANGSAIADAIVEIRQGSSVLNSTTTASDGSYTLFAIPGTYDVATYKTGYSDNTTTGVTVTMNSITSINFTLKKIIDGNVAGYLKDNMNNTIYGVTVELRQDSSTKAIATTDQNGFYNISITPGQYSMRLTKTGFDMTSISIINISSAQTTAQNSTIQASSTSGSISGAVYDNNLNAIDGARINIFRSDTKELIQAVFSNVGGTYRVNGLPTIYNYDLNATKVPTLNSTLFGQTNVAVPQGGLTTGKDIVLSP